LPNPSVWLTLICAEAPAIKKSESDIAANNWRTLKVMDVISSCITVCEEVWIFKKSLSRE